MEIAGRVGIRRLKLLVTANIKMWHHPKYYKELAKKLEASTAKLAGLAGRAKPSPAGLAAWTK